MKSILTLQERNGLICSINIINELGFTKSSVSVAMKNLWENGYILADRGSCITPDQKGTDSGQSNL